MVGIRVYDAILSQRTALLVLGGDLVGAASVAHVFLKDMFPATSMLAPTLVSVDFTPRWTGHETSFAPENASLIRSLSRPSQQSM